MLAAPSGQAADGNKLCVECRVKAGKPTGTSTSFRCSDCNSLRSRITRTLQKEGQEKVSAFKTLSKQEKIEFFAKNREAMGEELSAAVQDVITRVLKTTNEVEFKGTGEFLDEEDIRTKYASKPQQADAIIKNTRSIFDTMREVTVYEDMTYCSKVAASETLESSTGQSSTHDSYVKGKTAKKAKTPASKPESAGEATELSEAQKTLLGTFVAEIIEANLQLDVELASIETKEVKEFMVQASITQAVACGFKLKEFVAIVAVAVDNSSGDFNELKSQHRELKATGKDQVRRLKGQIKSAISLKIELQTPKMAKGTKRKADDVKKQPPAENVVVLEGADLD
jgi:hypothetical protein